MPRILNLKCRHVVSNQFRDYGVTCVAFVGKTRGGGGGSRSKSKHKPIAVTCTAAIGDSCMSKESRTTGHFGKSGLRAVQL